MSKETANKVYLTKVVKWAETKHLTQTAAAEKLGVNLAKLRSWLETYGVSWYRTKGNKETTTSASQVDFSTLPRPWEAEEEATDASSSTASNGERDTAEEKTHTQPAAATTV